MTDTTTNYPAASEAETLVRRTDRLEWGIVNIGTDDEMLWEATHATGVRYTAPTYWQLMSEINQHDAKMQTRLPWVAATVIFWVECFGEDRSIFSLAETRNALLDLGEDEALDWAGDNLGLQALSDIVGRVSEELQAAA